MWDILFYLVLVLALIAALAAGAFALRAYLRGASPREAMTLFFAPKPERRLWVVEQANVDGRRKLLIVRRDDVEHLIMTGGPVDVVIETGFHAPQPEAVVAADDAPVYAPGPREAARLGPVRERLKARQDAQDA